MRIKEITAYDMMEGNVKSFLDILSESFSVAYVPFGNNVDMFNNSTVMRGGNGYYTFFKVKNGSYICVLLIQTPNGYEVSFLHSRKASVDLKDYTFEKTEMFNTLRVFNNVIYVVSQLVKVSGVDLIFFRAYAKEGDDRLVKFYKKLVKNENFNRVMKDIGYEWGGEMLGMYFYERTLVNEKEEMICL